MRMVVRSIRFLPLLALVAPLAFAHVPEGTPKGHCEDPSEWSTHDYGSYAGGSFLFLGLDGSQGDCNGDTVPFDVDGHHEYADGGAFLLVDSGDGATGGTLACFEEPGHHPSFGPIAVSDLAFGSGVSFLVAVDIVILVPPTDPAEPTCGDNLDDVWAVCYGNCVVTFPPGLDGSYHVRVGDAANGNPGTQGHVFSP